MLWKILVLDVLRVAGDLSATNLAVIQNEDNPTQLCLGTVIDNSYMLTTCSCLKPEIESIIKGEKSGSNTNFFFQMFQSPMPKRVVDVLPYKYCATQNIWPEAIDDFAIIKFSAGKLIDEDKIVDNWPYRYLDYDFENMMDYFENESFSAHVWSNSKGTSKDFEPVLLSGVLVTREECTQRLKCRKSLAGLQPFDICRHFLGEPKANFRCVKLSERCSVNMVGAPVLIDDVVWGVSVRCADDLNVYLAFDRSFEFVFNKIQKYKTDWFNFLTVGIVIGTVFIIVAAVVFIVYFVKNK